MKTTIAVLVLTVLVFGADRIKSMYKVSRLSPSDLSIYCLNGGDPTARKWGQVLIISCGTGKAEVGDGR